MAIRQPEWSAGQTYAAAIQSNRSECGFELWTLQDHDNDGTSDKTPGSSLMQRLRRLRALVSASAQEDMRDTLAGKRHPAAYNPIVVSAQGLEHHSEIFGRDWD